MTLPLLATVVFASLLIAWLVEFRHREELLPSLQHSRHVPPVIVILVAALIGIAIVIVPLASLAEWPRSTQVAWIGAQTSDRTTGMLSIGGAEHSAILGWPNGNFLPEVQIAPGTDGNLHLRTRGGEALVRAGSEYANGDKITLGGGAKQIGKFSIELARTGWLRRRKLKISRTPVAEPLVVIDPPPVHATRVRVLDSLLVPRLNDLRRDGSIDLATIHALEEWAGSLRILMPDDDELRLVMDGEAWRELAIAPSSKVEILWPRRRLGMHVAADGGATRVSFEPPWTRTTSLPPLRDGASSLSFAREAAVGENTFLLPLGHGAPDFRHDEAVQISPAGLPRFRDGRDHVPAARPDAPRWMKSGGMLAAALEPNRTLSTVEIPLRAASSRGLILTIAMVRDLPTPRALFLALVSAWLALALFVASIAFGSAQRLRLRDLWCIGGVLVAVWTLLLFRVMLAVRYLLAPAAVDEVTVKGLSGTLASLVIVPGLITLAVRLWLHHRPGVPPSARSRNVTIFVALIFAALSAIELVVMPKQVLPNAAARFGSSPLDRMLLVVYLIAAIAIVSALPIRNSLAKLWQIPYRVMLEIGRTFWRNLGDAGVVRASGAPEGGGARTILPQPVLHVWSALRHPALKRPFLIWIAGSIAILALSRLAPEYTRQIVAPFWILGIPALVLLARPLALTEDALRVLDAGAAVATEPALPDTIAAIVLLAFAPIAVMFAALGDFGAIYMVLAFLLPLALLLLLTPALRMAGTLLIVIVTGVAVAYWALLGTYAVAPGMTEHILSRVEVMKHGSSAQEWLLDLEAPSAGDAKAVTAANVRNALVHEWEHLAMVRKGGWFGLGFNRAPAEQSFIRQDTIQYDSVYSFFVVGEHGAIGGLLLLAIFAAPALLLLMRRKSLRAGDMLALVIAAALLGEAAAHAAMNVAQLWFSGRNLPLLATSSNSDIVRWGILLGLMCQALLWSSRLHADSADTIPEALVTRKNVFDPAFAYAGRRRARHFAFGAIIAAGAIAAFVTKDFAWLAFACAIPLAIVLRTREVATLALLPAILVIVLVVRGSVRAIRSDEYDVLTWSRLLRRVDELQDNGTLHFDPSTKRISFRGADGKMTDRPSGATLLEAEVLRFNAMPERLRMNGGRESLPPAFFDVASPNDYYTRMFELWQAESERAVRERPSVFTINRIESESEGEPELAYEITGNPDFNVVHSFAEDLKEEQLQPVSIRGRSGPVEILGRAWVMGHWVYAPSVDARRLGLGWIHDAGAALFRVRSGQRARATQLTLDADLQRVTQATAEAAGRELFGGLTAQRAPAALPPRVAITIMRATNGETLAMGSWPRPASGDRWSSQTASDGKQTWREFEPPVTWLETSAPRALASHHAVDHNFTAIEMGSAAKPFWATAALTVHPSLDRQLFVHNGDCDRVANQRCYERQMFGVEMAKKGWQVAAFPRWIDFSTYLAASDNRYHTRLGFLSLARENANAIADDGRGRSISGRESLTGSSTPWNRYPALPDSTENSRDHASHLADLHQQPVATKMRDLFGARTGAPPPEGDQRRYLLSFWSGDERDDLRASNGLEPMAAISPEAVDLRLNRIHDTREFVAVLLGGASSRWSNIAAAAAFSSWAMRKPVVPHVVARDSATVPLPSRAAAFDDAANAAARKLSTGLKRVIDDGTAISIRNRLAPLAAQYEIYAKTGTLSTIDRDRPTSRIMIVIIKRNADGTPRNAITLSFVAERSSPGFATAQAGRFIERYQSELVRLLESEGAGR
ncbi:MAG: hypothetical protein DMF56_08560 [Acidobacteria bacterium]|nr:MAG: hypothetical protein DMF56_08560 [Acidobacteriota bacterium]